MISTYVMDGLLTEEDINNRHSVVFQCMKCNKWTTHHNWLPSGHNKHIPCTNCGSMLYDGRSIKSLRTYNPLNDNKRKIK